MIDNPDELITRPARDDYAAALEDKRRVQRSLTRHREHQLRELVYRELDAYLEQRLLYRQLIREGRHKGVEPPKRSQFVGANAPSLRAKTTHTETVPSDPTVSRPVIASSTSGRSTAPLMTGHIVRGGSMAPGQIIGVY